MRTEKLIEQLDLYSNAIVGFMVAQSIAFSFTFGTNVPFGCEITRWKALAAGLTLHFVLSTVVSSWATVAISRRMCALSLESESPLTPLGLETLRTSARAKSGVMALFALIPVVLLVFFGILAKPETGRCSPGTPKVALINSAA